MRLGQVKDDIVEDGRRRGLGGWERPLVTTQPPSPVLGYRPMIWSSTSSTFPNMASLTITGRSGQVNSRERGAREHVGLATDKLM